MALWKAALFLLAFSCSTQTPQKQPDPNPDLAKNNQAPTTASALTPASIAAPAIKRRLYVDKAEASSFLNQKKSLIWDRYHPNYALDDNPSSAWNEGAESSGASEWIRLPITKQENLTALTLRMMNGYQKSEALFQANTRAKTIQVKLLPGNQTKNITLEDKMGWQEVVLSDVKAEVVEAIEFTIVDVYEGGKYKDLCLSEIEVYATSTTKEDPEVEALKQKQLLAWVSGQQDALALLKSDGVLPDYEVEALDSFPGFSEEAKLFMETNKAEVPMSTARLVSSKQEFTAPGGFESPCVDIAGREIYYEDSDIVDEDDASVKAPEVYVADSAYLAMPCFDSFSLFTSAAVSVKEKKETKTCDIETFVPTENLTVGGLLRIIEIQICGEYTEYDSIGRPGAGEYKKRKTQSTATQSLLYDEAGRLRVLYGKEETIWFDWTKQNGHWVMSGGLRDTPPARLIPVLQEGTSLPATIPVVVPSTAPAASAPASTQATPTSAP